MLLIDAVHAYWACAVAHCTGAVIGGKIWERILLIDKTGKYMTVFLLILGQNKKEHYICFKLTAMSNI